VQCCLLSKFHCTLSLYFFLYHSFFALFVGSFHFISTIWWHYSSSKTCEFSKMYCIVIIMLLFYCVFLIIIFTLFGNVLKFGNVTTQHKALHNQISCENLNLVMLLSFLCETIKWMCCNKTHSGNASSVKILEAQSNNNVFKFLKHEVVACYKFLKCNIVKIQKTWGAWWLCIWMGVGVCVHENEMFWWMSITFGLLSFFLEL